MAQIYPRPARQSAGSHARIEETNSSGTCQMRTGTRLAEFGRNAAVTLHTRSDGRVGSRVFAMPGAAAVDSDQTKFDLCQLPSRTCATHGAHDAIDRP
jgi:hypothetical protein